MHLDGDVFNAGDVRNMRGDVKTGADGNGIALPLGGLACCLGGISDDMFSLERPRHGIDSGVEVNVGPEVKMCAILVEILDISLGGHEVSIGL